MSKEILQQAIDFAEYCLEELELSYMASNQAKRLIEKSEEALAKQEQGEPDDEVLGFNGWGFPIEHPPKPTPATKEQIREALVFNLPLYTTPQPAQKPWVGLTDEEVKKIAYNNIEVKVARAIEAKLKEKNT